MEEILGSDNENVLIDFSPVFNASDIKTRILMWHGLQDPISSYITYGPYERSFRKRTISNIKRLPCQNLDILLDKKMT